MHAEAFEWVRKIAWSLPPLLNVAEFGGRAVNGSVREIFTDAAEPGGRYLSCDLIPGAGVDVVADAAEWDVPGVRFDAVVCCEVLEHTPRGWAICANAHRLLRDGGVFIVTCASPSRAPHSAEGDGPPRPGEYYAGVSVAELRSWLWPFRFALIDGHSYQQDAHAIAIK